MIGKSDPKTPKKSGDEAGQAATTPAERALAEAEARRKAAMSQTGALPPEKGGRKGPEPTRYGDWEKGGIASDF
ncbi:MAG: DUF1674 domain-containing protein [Rhodomicrobiaceae bacterium]